MSQQGQVLKLKTRGADGKPTWAYAAFWRAKILWGALTRLWGSDGRRQP
jgi:hypothetical protein